MDSLRLVAGAKVAVLVWACRAASALTPFTEEALSRGIDYLVRDTGGQGFGFGVAFIDLDGDGDQDLVVLGATDGTVGVYENDGAGHFIDRSAASGLPARYYSGISATDYNADGKIDLFIGGFFSADLLARNLGGFTFTDMAASAGVVGGNYTTGSAWGDYDGDGWLDFYVSEYFTPNRLYRHQGASGTFQNMAAVLGVDDGTALSFQGVFWDYDLDGDADLYLSNDRNIISCPHPNRLWKNQGGSFLDVTSQSGTGACIDSMGVAVGDFDRNGHFDLYPTNTDNGVTNGNPLFLNQGDGTFVESSVQAGVTSNQTGWAAIFADFNNDMHLDLYVCNEAGPNRLYMHGGTWPAVDLAATGGVADASAHSFGAAVADIDGDGDLDLVVSSIARPIRLFINHEGSQRRWLRVRMVGTHPNLNAIGAIAWVTVDGVTQVREVLAGSNSYLSQNELVLHFGMDTHLMTETIQVMWPGGATRTLQNYPTNHVWSVYPAPRLGDFDGDGAPHDAIDHQGLVGCLSGPTRGSVLPGCEMMDIDGDGDVDLGDYAAFQRHFGQPLALLPTRGSEFREWQFMP